MDNSPTIDLRGDSSSARTSVSPSGSRFRIVKLHATGGLGQVSLAIDEQLRREVALKEIQQRHADDAISRLRFLREAEITGRLEHPGIVPVYGLDTDEEGRPRYAMRFIHGQSLDEAIRQFHQADKQPYSPSERTLALRALLTRFVSTCQTIAFAHSRGVIHRDLKPANVMLGAFGETLVVDWGLARVLQTSVNLDSSEGDCRPLATPGSSVGDYALSSPRPLASSTESDHVAVPVDSEEVTQLGQVIGTPSYLPPEQANGETEKINFATDVWALGATLYCLLTGQPPYSGTRDEVIRQAQRGVVTPVRQIKPEVPRPLAAICEKALALRVEDRYASAQDLAGDVERWLADEPLHAHREATVERLGRWMRRRRTLMVALAALLLTSVVGLSIGFVLVQAEQRKTAEQRDLALEAEQVAKENLDRAVLAEKEARENLKEAENAVNECLTYGHDDPRLQTIQLREVRRDLMIKTLPYFERFSKKRPDDESIAASHAQWLYRIGEIEAELSQVKSAVQRLRQARDIYERLHQAHPEKISYQINLASTCGSLGNVYSSLGQLPLAKEQYLRALALQTELTQKNPSSKRFIVDLAFSYINLGQLLSDEGDSREAVVQLRRAEELLRSLLARDTKEKRFLLELGRTLDCIGLEYAKQRENDQAEEYFQQALKVLRSLASDAEDDRLIQTNCAGACSNYARFLRVTGKVEASLPLYDEAIARLFTVLKKQIDFGPARIYLRVSLVQRAGALETLGRHREAAANWEKATELARGAARLTLRYNQAAALARAGEFDAVDAVMQLIEEQETVHLESCLDLAALCSRAANDALGQHLIPLPVREKRSRLLVRRMSSFLERAAKLGLFRNKNETFKKFQTNPNLAHLRQRPEWSEWLKRWTTSLK